MTREYWREYIAKGKCRTGDGNLLVSKQYCASHLAKMKKYQRNLMQKGLCTTGDGNLLAVTSNWLCEKHRKQYNLRRKNLVANGLCRSSDGNKLEPGSSTCGNCKERMRQKVRLLYEKALLVVANSKGDDVPRCRFDLTPAGLLDVPCKGKLQIDHISGDGALEVKRQPGVFYRKIVNGERALDDLRVLCELHNWAFKIVCEEAKP